MPENKTQYQTEISPEDVAIIDSKFTRAMFAILTSQEPESIKVAVHELREVIDIFLKYNLHPDVKAQLKEPLMEIIKDTKIDQSLFTELTEILPLLSDSTAEGLN